MQSHRKSFFGQKTGMVISSKDWAEPFVMLTFIKKKGTSGNEWEKFAEGKTLKINLVELAAIRDVVRGAKPTWKTFHKYNGSGTPIEVRWENDKQETIVFLAGGYVRPVQWPESVVLAHLLDHIFAEKIQNATNPQGAPEAPTVEELPDSVEAPAPASPVVEEHRPEKKSQDAYVPDGIMVQPHTIPSVTEKAVCMENEAGRKIWVPKSAILGEIPGAPTESPASYALKGWFVKKKEIKEWIAGA